MKKILLIFLLIKICIVNASADISLDNDSCMKINRTAQYDYGAGENVIFLAGYVRDKKGKWPNVAVDGATVLIFYRNRILYELRTNRDGWFHAEKPLGIGCVGKYLSILVFAKGYRSYEAREVMVKSSGVKEIKAFNEVSRLDEITIQPNNLYKIELDSISQDKANKGYLASDINRFYGYIYDEKGTPVDLSVVSILGNKRSVLSKAITSESGYFSLPVPGQVKSSKINVRVGHEEFDSKTRQYDIEKDEFFTQQLTKDVRHVIPGLGFQLSHVNDHDKDILDQVTRDARHWHFDGVLNFAYFPEGVLLRDGAIRLEENWRVGWDLSFAYSEALQIDSTSDKGGSNKRVFKAGIGGALLKKNNDFLYRFGLFRSEAGELGWYFGVSVPLTFWKIY